MLLFLYTSTTKKKTIDFLISEMDSAKIKLHICVKKLVQLNPPYGHPLIQSPCYYSHLILAQFDQEKVDEEPLCGYATANSHLFVCLSVHSFVCLFIPLFVCSFIRSFIYLFIRFQTKDAWYG